MEWNRLLQCKFKQSLVRVAGDLRVVIFGVLVVMCCRPEKSCQERKIDLIFWNPCNPSGPSSRPNPESLIPPYGAAMSGR